MGAIVKYWKGAWWIFVNYQGKRKSKRVGTGEAGKRAAKEAATKIQARLALGVPFAQETRTPPLADYARTWLQTYAAVECKPRTHELYEAMIRLHLLPTLGTTCLADLKRDQIRQLLADKAAVPLKRSTLQNILAPLREMLNHALEDGIITSNPAARLGRRLARLRNEDQGKRLSIFTEPELSHLLTVADGEWPEHTDVIHAAAWTGLRQGEAFGLQWPDVDFHNGFLEIRRTVGYRKGGIMIGTPKSGKVRRVDIPTMLVKRLLKRLERAKECAALNEKAVVPWLFPNRAGNPLDGGNFLDRVWYPLLAQAGLRRLPFHTLRHTYASLLIMRGENLAYIKDQLGHSSVQVTVDLYGHLIPGTHRGAVDRLAEATKRNPRATTVRKERAEESEAVDFLEPASGIEPPTC